VAVTAEGLRLIVVRGNSASGKSTLARELQLAMGRGTANIGQDHFRRIVLREHDIPHGDNITLIEQTAQHCLALGYHVIVEGILVAEHYGSMLRGLIASHLGPHHIFYLDVSLEETLKRHAGRALSGEVDAAKLREWYVPFDVLAVPGEVVLDNNANLIALNAVLEHVGPVAPRDVHGSSRFL